MRIVKEIGSLNRKLLLQLQTNINDMYAQHYIRYRLHPVRDASLGRKVIRPQDAFRTECIQQWDTFSTERCNPNGLQEADCT
ncbi:MAG: hypothetical protein LBE91_22430 [Tannerella sp.]|nr:hypothetical protein [Tannerella sp.]